MTRPLERVRIGCVKYLNARPLIAGCTTSVSFDHPAALCEKLSRGELDVALVSSFEFLRNPIYAIVNGVAIASDGPVYSVVLAHQSPLPELTKVELDPASETSINLLQCLLAETGFALNLNAAEHDNLSPISARTARLLIGDQAIHFRRKFGMKYAYWDLGEQWQTLVRQPFVYALWLVRPEVSGAEEIGAELRALRDANLRNLDDVAAAQSEFDAEFCSFYYRRCLRFDFGEKEQRGLLEFRRSCEKYNLLPARETPLRLV